MSLESPFSGIYIHNFQTTHELASHKFHLQSDNNGGGEIELPGGGDDALGDHVAPHDPTEDVHEESVHFWVPSDDFESLFHLEERLRHSGEN